MRLEDQGQIPPHEDDRESGQSQRPWPEHPSGERLIAVPFRSHPVSPDLDLVVGPCGCHLLSKAQTSALRAFSRLRDAAISDAGGGIGVADSLMRLGLLVSEGQIVAEVQRGILEQEKATIESAGIITCARPEHLARCARALIENAAANGRRLEIVVIDVSPRLATRRRNIDHLRRLSAVANIRYCGPENRRAYRARLAGLGIGLRLSDITFCRPAPSTNFGAARNALMLDQAGVAFISADDDVIARTAIHPALTGSIRLIGAADPFDHWFFQDRMSAIRWAKQAPVDIIGQHCEYLGQNLPSLLAKGANRFCIERICGHFADPAWRPRVVGTMAGRVGDSGRIDPNWETNIGEWSSGRSGLGRLEVVELPESAAIVHDVGCMTTMVGLDCRSILPPFVPRNHGEDGLFAAMISKAMPNACWGVVPHGIIHDRPPRLDDEPPTFPGFAEMLGLLIAALPMRREGEGDAEAISAAGGALIRAVEMATPALRVLMLTHLSRSLSLKLERLRKTAEGEAPEGQRSHLEFIQKRLVTDFSRICAQTSEFPTAGLSWDDFRSQVRDYGEILAKWPAIVRAAQDLRSRGIRISAPLSQL